MTETIAEYLLSPSGRGLLAEAKALWDGRCDPLTALTRLRKAAAPEQAAASWEMAGLRRRAQVKFGASATHMYFTREALEQASSARAARYHAHRFGQVGIAIVSDLCGGIGGDALAFAEAGMHVTLYERDPVRARFAAENARVHGCEDRIAVISADVTTVPLKTDAAWFDPARRAEQRRVGDPEAYAPPLSLLRGLAAQGVTDIGVKLSPAIDHAIAAEYGADLEFLSDSGECKEALLWLGRLKSGSPVRATVITDAGKVSLETGPDEVISPSAGIGRFLYEPDPAVIRAHLVQMLAKQLGASLLDPHIAYLTGDIYVPTAFADAYEILSHFPYHLKRLQEALNAREVGHVVIKKRGFPLEPDAVRRQLKLSGPNAMTIVLTRIGAGHHVFLCRPERV